MGAEKAIEDFLSGGNLVNGVCSDCHAGENPFIVHPAGPLNMFPDNQPQNWHSPLVKPSWPKNPGPFGLLAQALRKLDSGNAIRKSGHVIQLFGPCSLTAKSGTLDHQCIDGFPGRIQGGRQAGRPAAEHD